MLSGPHVCAVDVDASNAELNTTFNGIQTDCTTLRRSGDAILFLSKKSFDVTVSNQNETATPAPNGITDQNSTQKYYYYYAFQLPKAKGTGYTFGISASAGNSTYDTNRVMNICNYDQSCLEKAAPARAGLDIRIITDPPNNLIDFCYNNWQEKYDIPWHNAHPGAACPASDPLPKANESSFGSHVPGWSGILLVLVAYKVLRRSLRRFRF